MPKLVSRVLNRIAATSGLRDSLYVHGVQSLKKQLAGIDARDGQYFMVVMPGALHIADRALADAPASFDIPIIFNGLDRFEARWMRNQYPARTVVQSRVVLRHADVLDAIFQSRDRDFGIIDHDCFIRDWSLPEQMKQTGFEHCLNAAFVADNSSSVFEVPETFLLYFNSRYFRELMERYDEGCAAKSWSELKPKAAAILAEKGFSDSRYPEVHKPYFDTLRVLIALAVADGVPPRFVERLATEPDPAARVFHVGGVSDPNNSCNIWSFRGSWFWRELLTGADPRLVDWYRSRYPTDSADALLRGSPALAEQLGAPFRNCTRQMAAPASAPKSVVNG